MTIGLGRYGYGVLRLVAPGVILHWCEGCNAGHTLDVHALNHDGRVIGWDGDVDRPSIAEQVRHDLPAGGRCEYTIRGGVIHYSPDCTHALAGKSLPMRDYPMP